MLGLRSDFLKKGKVALKVQQFGLWRGGEGWRDCLCRKWREEYLYSPTRKALVLPRSRSVPEDFWGLGSLLSTEKSAQGGRAKRM